MNDRAAQKVTASHLARLAYLYIRQSTLRQVLEHTESTVRQYALRERAVALGWPREQIVVIDERPGPLRRLRRRPDRLPGAGGRGRPGPGRPGHWGWRSRAWRATTATGTGCWRSARLTDTLILDEDGIYDPATFNDRLLLGLKGTMWEAELHVLRARLRGGILNKARRGALKLPLPVGLGLPRGRPGRPRPRPAGPGGAAAASSRPSGAPARPAPRCATSASRSCASRAGCAPGRTAARWSGGRCSTAPCSTCCTTRATPAPSSSAARAPGRRPTAAAG